MYVMTRGRQLGDDGDITGDTDPGSPNPPQPIPSGESAPGCGPGEEWDWNAMACVTAGQATIPGTPSGSGVPVDGGCPAGMVGLPPLCFKAPGAPTFPSGQPTSGQPASTSTSAGVSRNYTPWILGGVAVVVAGLLFTAVAGRTAARANPARRRRGHRVRVVKVAPGHYQVHETRGGHHEGGADFTGPRARASAQALKKRLTNRT